MWLFFFSLVGEPNTLNNQNTGLNGQANTLNLVVLYALVNGPNNWIKKPYVLVNALNIWLQMNAYSFGLWL